MTALTNGLYMWDETRVYGDQGVLELQRPLGEPLGWTLEARFADHKESVTACPTVGRATLDFVDAVVAGRTPRCRFADAWLSVRLIEAAYASAADGGTWIDV